MGKELRKRLWPEGTGQRFQAGFGYLGTASGILTGVYAIMSGAGPVHILTTSALLFLGSVLIVLAALVEDFVTPHQYAVAVAVLVLGVVLIVVGGYRAWDCREGRCAEVDLEIAIEPGLHPGGNVAGLDVIGAWDPDLSKWECQWFVRNEAFGTRACDAELNFFVDDNESEVKIRVEAIDVWSRPHVATQNFEVTVFRILGNNTTARAEQVIELRVLAGDSPLTEDYQCTWDDARRTDSGQAVASPSDRESCSPTLIPPADDGREDYVVELNVEINPVAGETRTLPVKVRVQHPHNHAMIVLDVTERMSAVLDDPPNAALNIAKEHLAFRLNEIAEHGGVFVGVQTFGEEVSEGRICDNTRELVNLYGREAALESAIQAIRGLNPGEPKGPLEDALLAASEKLEAAPDSIRTEYDRFYLIAISGGEDECTGKSLSQAIDQLALERGPVASRAAVEFKLLSLTVGVPIRIDPAELALSFADGTRGIASVVVIADEEVVSLRTALGVVDGLLDPASASDSCSRLQKLVAEQSNRYDVDLGSENLEIFCSQLPQ